jgi:hypothetical protein
VGIKPTKKIFLSHIIRFQIWWAFHQEKF